MKEPRFFLCKHCGNQVEMVLDSGVPVICCGEPMTELIPGSVDASHEKHVPVVSQENGQILVKVGSAPHPMEPQHYIQWIALLTDKGISRKELKPGAPAEAAFVLGDEAPRAVYAYCNIHGLWKTEL